MREPRPPREKPAPQDIATLRLALVTLTYTHGRDAKEAIARAQELEAYVTGK